MVSLEIGSQGYESDLLFISNLEKEIASLATQDNAFTRMLTNIHNFNAGQKKILGRQ